jgi:hypothetical protein
VDILHDSGFTPKALVITGFKTADKLLASWGCTQQDIQNILKVPKSAYEEFKVDPETIKLSDDQLERISYLLHIHQTLRLVFSNPVNVSVFMSSVNDNDFFAGRTPLEIIGSGNFVDLHEVARRIASLQDIPCSIDLPYTEQQLLARLDSTGAELLVSPDDNEWDKSK